MPINAELAKVIKTIKDLTDLNLKKNAQNALKAIISANNPKTMSEAIDRHMPFWSSLGIPKKGAGTTYDQYISGAPTPQDLKKLAEAQLALMNPEAAKVEQSPVIAPTPAETNPVTNPVPPAEVKPNVNPIETKTLQAINAVQQLQGSPLRAKAAEALGELIKVNLTDSDAQTKFVAAVQTHLHDFWSKAPLSLPAKKDGEEYLSVASLKGLQQKAAEQLVLLGLNNADDNTLIGLFENQNADDLRKYIGDKVAKEPLKAALAAPSPTPSKELLNDEALKMIKAQAAELLLLKKIATDMSGHLIKALLVAKTTDETKAAVRALGVKHDLDKISDKIMESAKQKYIETAYSSSVKDLSPAALGALQKALEGDFAAHLKQELGVDFSAEQVKSAKTHLSARYVPHALSTVPGVTAEEINEIKSLDDLKKYAESKLGKRDYIDLAINEGTEATMKATLIKSLINQKTVADSELLSKLINKVKPDEYRETLKDNLKIDPVDWITEADIEAIRSTADEKMKEIRASNLPGVVQQLKINDRLSALIALAQEENLNKFHQIITPLAKPPHWIDAVSMRSIQKTAANRATELKIGQLSGGSPHPSLIKIINDMDLDKQLKLLNDSTRLKHLLSAKTEEDVHHYLGMDSDSSVASTVQTENARVAQFAKIHNAAVANILMKHTPPISLSDEQVKKIHDIVYTGSVKFEDNMRAVVNTIAGKSEQGLQDRINPLDKTLFDSLMANEANILRIRTMNQPLQRFYGSPSSTPLEKEMLDVLLSLDVKVKYNDKKDEFCDTLIQALNNSETTEGFIDALVNSAQIIPENPNNPQVAATQRADLKEKLSQKLSPSQFNDWRIQSKKEVLEFGEEGDKIQIASEILKELETIKKEQKPFIKASEVLGKLNESTLDGPAFDAHIKSKPVAMKQEYMDLLQKSTLIIDRLERSKNLLQKYYDAIPTPASPKQLEKLKSTLEKEVTELKKQLQVYEEARNKIISVVQEIDRVMVGKEEYVFNGQGISHETASDEQLAKIKEKAKKDFTATAVDGVSATLGAPFDVVEKMKLKDGDKHYVYTVQDDATPEPTSTVPNPQPVSTQGIFVQTYSQKDASVTSSKDDKLSRNPVCKVELIQQPKLSANHQAQGVKEVPDHAKANFYMDMALSLITANGGKAPTYGNPIRLRGGTREQMESLWTALAIVCKEKYGYNHGQILSAIKVETGSFNPNNVVEPRRFREPVFKEDSIYKTVFQTDSGKAAVTAKLEEASVLIDKAKDTRKDISTAEKAVDGFKGKMQQMKAEEALKKAEETRTKEGIVKPDPEPSSLKYQR